MFTLIGGGMKRLEQSFRYMADVLPKKIQWIKERAIHFDPNNNTVSTSGGHDIKYDMLLIASGLELKYEKVMRNFTNIVDNVKDTLTIPDTRFGRRSCNS